MNLLSFLLFQWFLPSTPIIEREPDTELFYTAGRPKSQDDTSTLVTPEWRNSPVVKALTQRNSGGKIVCPFTACGKQYVSDAQFGKHMMRDHYKELSMKDTEKIRRRKKENFYYFSSTN